jgi:alanyl-tRNA synthetase
MPQPPNDPTQTQKFYEADAYRTEMAAHILAVRALPAGGWAIAPDATVFYPEGGGQSADTGTLTVLSPADAAPLALAVTDVHEQGGLIWHTVAAPAGVALSENALPMGATVTGRIDWARRFDQMQQHTGEHILSGILHRMFGAENVGFHIGSEAVRMDTSVPIAPEGLREAELAANRVVWQDVPVQAAYPSPEELARLTYRSKKALDGAVRIVTIPGADVCACCGTHTATSGQVGQIKILAAEHYKGGMRLAVVCGERALRAAQEMRSRQARIGALLSAKPGETANAVQRVYDAYTQLKFDHFGLCAQLFDALAAGIASGERGPQAVCLRTVPGLDPDGLHRLAARLCEATDAVCVALTPTANGTGYCLAQANGDLRALTKALNAACNGRGGGKPGICQGSCTAAPPEVEAFLRSAMQPEA